MQDDQANEDIVKKFICNSCFLCFFFCLFFKYHHSLDKNAILQEYTQRLTEMALKLFSTPWPFSR